MHNRICFDHKQYMSNVRLEPFLPLPVELVRFIFELSARNDRWTSILLLSVSRAVRKWVTPIVYRTVILRGLDQTLAFRHTLQVVSPSLGTYVNRLYLDGFYEGVSDIIPNILNSCAKLEFLITTGPILYRLRQSENPLIPFPWHLILLDAKLLPPLEPQLGWNITHLHLDDFDERHYHMVQSLPHLTHLGFLFFGDTAPRGYLTRIFRVLSLPFLAVLLLHAFDRDHKPAKLLVGWSWRALANVKDERLLVGRGFCRDFYVGLIDVEGTMWDDAKTRFKDWRMLVKDADET